MPFSAITWLRRTRLWTKRIDIRPTRRDLTMSVEADRQLSPVSVKRRSASRAGARVTACTVQA